MFRLVICWCGFLLIFYLFHLKREQHIVINVIKIIENDNQTMCEIFETPQDVENVVNRVIYKNRLLVQFPVLFVGIKN